MTTQPSRSMTKLPEDILTDLYNSGTAMFLPKNRSLVWDDVQDIPLELWPSGRYILCPIMAAFLLEHNEENRILSKPHVKAIEQQLNQGDWEIQGSSIVIFSTGIMGDGQHRCHAVINTGISAETMFTTNVSPRAFTKIDTIHHNRNKGFAVKSFKNATYKGATGTAATWVWKYAKGLTPQGSNYMNLTDAIYSTSNEDVFNLITRYNPVIIDYVNRIAGDKDLRPFYANGLAAVAFMASLVDDARVEEFIHGIATGSNLDENDPRLRFRNIFQRKTGKQSVVGKAFSVKVAIMINAWNAFYLNRTPTEGSLMYTIGDPYPELVNLPPSAVDINRSPTV